MRIGDEVCYFISLYRSPNQPLEEFETFSKNNSFLIVLCDDLNAKLSKWYEHDSTFYEST